MVDLMLGKFIKPKYFDLRSPFMNVYIASKLVPKVFIDLGSSINIMTYAIMDSLSIDYLKLTLIILHLGNRSIVTPKGILEDVIVLFDSWEYPIDFMVLKPKSNLGDIQSF